jgi:hypothetical protein
MDTGQEALRHQHKSGFEVIVHLVGFCNLGRERNHQGIPLKMDRTQVDGSEPVAFVAEDNQDVFQFIGLPIGLEAGIVKDEDVILEMLQPLCAGQVYEGHLEVFQPFLIQFFIVSHCLLRFFSTKVSNFSTQGRRIGKIEQHFRISANNNAILLVYFCRPKEK